MVPVLSQTYRSCIDNKKRINHKLPANRQRELGVGAHRCRTQLSLKCIGINRLPAAIHTEVCVVRRSTEAGAVGMGGFKIKAYDPMMK